MALGVQAENEAKKGPLGGGANLPWFSLVRRGWSGCAHRYGLHLAILWFQTWVLSWRRGGGGGAQIASASHA